MEFGAQAIIDILVILVAVGISWGILKTKVDGLQSQITNLRERHYKMDEASRESSTILTRLEANQDNMKEDLKEIKEWLRRIENGKTGY